MLAEILLDNETTSIEFHPIRLVCICGQGFLTLQLVAQGFKSSISNLTRLLGWFCNNELLARVTRVTPAARLQTKTPIPRILYTKGPGKSIDQTRNLPHWHNLLSGPLMFANFVAQPRRSQTLADSLPIIQGISLLRKTSGLQSRPWRSTRCCPRNEQKM